MALKPATYNLSSRWIGPWKVVLFAVYGIVFSGILLYLILSDRTLISKVYHLLIVAVPFYWLVRMTYLVQKVSFDEEYLYVSGKRQDVVIPLENIESVKINTLGGVYKVSTLFPEQFGKAFYFKPSLLYPFNYKSKDAIVRQLRQQIRKVKTDDFHRG